MVTRTVMGDLEAAVADYAWSHDPLDVKTMHAAIGVRRGISLHTVQSTMERLFRKGLLQREKRGNSYFYSPRVSREQWLAQSFQALVERLSGAEGDAMLVAFVSLAERAGDESLDRLANMVRKARRGRGKKS